MSHRKGFIFLVFLFLQFVLYSPSLFFGLVADDYVFHSVAARPVLSLWVEPSDVHGHWRPLSYSVKHLLFSFLGESPFGWHFINFMLHLATVFMLYVLLKQCVKVLERPGGWFPFAGAVFFQIHPASVQNVSWVSGFSDLLALFAILVSASLFLHSFKDEKLRTHYIIASIVAYVVALLSKESSVIFPVFALFLGFITSGQTLSVRNSWDQFRKQGGFFLLAVTFLYFVTWFFVSGGMFLEDRTHDGFSEWWGVILRGVAMLAVPTDAFGIYHLYLSAPWSAIAAAGIAGILFTVSLNRPELRRHVVPASLVLLGASLFVYVIAGYISLRLMFLPVCLLTIVMGVAAARGNWHGMEKRIGVTAFCLFVGMTVFFSVSAVLDWHVADKQAKEIRAAFQDVHELTPQNDYIFGAIPARLRQAPIVGEAATDFNGVLRDRGLDVSVPMTQVLRVVLLSRDDSAANVRVERVSESAIEVAVVSADQFLQIGDLRTPLELPAGTAFSAKTHRIWVREAHLGNRARRIEIESLGLELARLLFYDHQSDRFLFLDDYLAVQNRGTL